LEKIRVRGAEICELTLNVGLGTFQPIHSETLEGHVMHSESYEIPQETAERIQAARTAGRSVLAIGTTVVRALENAALRAAESGSANLVVPGKALRTLLFYSLKTRTRVWPAKRTSLTWPFSAKSSES